MRALRRHLIQKVMESDDEFTRETQKFSGYKRHLNQFTDAEIQAELAMEMVGEDFED